MSDYIPTDILPSIFARLTPSTLLRCRCVCRSWKSLISTPFLIASHLAFQKPCLIAAESNKLHQIQLQNNFSLFSQTLTSFDFPFRSAHPSNFRIVGTVNGVICLIDDFLGTIESIVLWNPLIRRFLHPPKPINSSSHTHYASALGFGTDASGTDLKIVRIARATGALMFGRRRQSPAQAEVYSSREGKWRSIEYKNANCHTRENQWSQSLLQGAVHWPAFLISTRNVLLSFHFETEAFKVMELPLELQRGTVSVSEMGQMVSVVDYGAHGCDVWAMREYGEASSWCKMVRVDWVGGGGLRNVIWVREDGGEMVVSNQREEALCYDTSDLDSAKSIGISCQGHGYFAHGFFPSLVLLEDS